ncbi:lysophospholipase L1-like esterase [Brevundimonas alba]|uniref:Lysophospholipase L1-like esterase n=1 Tax=Brevundimonas alba TaxID=74314 RepID=A0A7X6BNJ4_9CAUL|nr:GDSL-type esterase/lipase family protein [Brevundimonas alba]NJC42233.1 lysophospholipase L1-like esterase [Brevundimonas alba]
MNRVRAILAGVLIGAGLLSSAAAPAWAEAAAPAAGVSPQQDSAVRPPAGWDNAWLLDHYRERTTVFSGYEPLNGAGVAFVGDSITEGGDWAALFPGVPVRNYGIGGDRSDGVLARAAQVVGARPQRIILMIGTNDLANGYTPEAIAADVGRVLALWKAALPDTQLVVESVLPRQPEFDARIRDLNTRLMQTAAANGADWIDIHTAFLTQGDRLDPAVTADDLHLTPPGYARWKTIIEPCVRTGECGA